MHVCGIQKNDQVDLISKGEIDVENKHMDTREKGKGRMNWEIGIDIYTLLCTKQVTNKNLLYGTGNSIQCSVDLNGNEIQKKEGHVL